MAQRKNDIDKIGDVILDFFKTKRIRESLRSIHELEISGWEKWWQTELAIYLANAPSIAEWDMEHPFDTDKRTSLVQNRMALDIGFRLEHHSKNDWLFVELKQDDNYRRCIDKMCKDVEKVFSARKRSFDGLTIRYVACAGVFLSDSDEDVLDYAEEMLERIRVDHDGLFLEKISDHHSIIIF